MMIEARDLRHSFGSAAVLRGVDLSGADGEVVGLVGPNGSGKTTVLRILHHSLVPDAGQVLLDGRDLAGFTGRQRARRIAVMAQDVSSEVPLSVADVVLLGRIPHRGTVATTTRTDERVAAGALEQVGALGLARQRFGTLSGGERQRVLVARALAQQPGLLLMDEPTNHLDIGAQHQVLTIVREQRLTTVVVLHDLNLAARYCDRVLVLAGGTVAADGPPHQVLDEQLVGATYGIRADRRTAADGTAQFLFRGGEPDRWSSPTPPTGPGPGTRSAAPRIRG